MINLRNDYCGICHPKILEALQKASTKAFVGYGLDSPLLYFADFLYDTNGLNCKSKCNPSDFNSL